ncbi:decarboxylase [Candidatus Woesearchaeota archaeon]|jgi:ornithine decarboxylase|nr:decarboxylase [Candidatus Woesearchaeota archaeon]MBT3438382.1 decarboxylase [Candidatus Woesearchaeota archaeon]MBT4058363.1 decarboxylase [Candidatus Woesearchaeota archaeon]MBT4207609.1 decarboxylase [Candidatus Woesearchaeota archaeon]MBT4730628.1 decarboxylase [Candidatus Woesearchaeota archaeon]
MSRAKFILNKSKVIEQLNKTYELTDIVSYFLKTNYEVGKILEKESKCQFSVHSMKVAHEIESPERIWFFAQAWNKEELKNLLKREITSFVVDNEKDLQVLLENTTTKVNLLLRMKLQENTVHTGKHFVFGFSSKRANELIGELSTHRKINKIGIHFHRKTQNVSEWGIKEELQDSLTQETLDQISFVNIGGGLPSIYKNYKLEALDSIFTKIKEVKEWLNQNEVKMIIEPGRFIAAPSIKLETSVKNVYNGNVIVNASVYNSAMDTFIANIRLNVAGETTAEEGRPFTIKGITPDSLDIFRYRVFLSKKPKIGDQIIFLNAGAYNFSTDFCKLPKIPTEVVE